MEGGIKDGKDVIGVQLILLTTQYEAVALFVIASSEAKEGGVCSQTGGCFHLDQTSKLTGSRIIPRVNQQQIYCRFMRSTVVYWLYIVTRG